MKILPLGFLFIAMTFCGLGDRLKNLTGSPSSNSNSTASNTPPSNSSKPEVTVEKATLSGAQQTIISEGAETKWDDQGLAWTLPKSWSKMDVQKLSFNYKSSDGAFLLANISQLGDNFPMEISLKAYYDQAMQKLKTGDYESARMLEIDGIQGVEFTEAAPKGKDDIRRHQWIAYRRYLGQVQQLNVMTTTKASNFDKHKDDFPAILYSMKATK